MNNQIGEKQQVGDPLQQIGMGSATDADQDGIVAF